MTEPKPNLSENIKQLIQVSLAKETKDLLRSDLSNLSINATESLIQKISDRLIDSNNFLDSVSGRVYEKISGKRGERLISLFRNVTSFLGCVVSLLVPILAASDTAVEFLISILTWIFLGNK